MLLEKLTEIFGYSEDGPVALIPDNALLSSAPGLRMTLFYFPSTVVGIHKGKTHMNILCIHVMSKEMPFNNQSDVSEKNRKNLLYFLLWIMEHCQVVFMLVLAEAQTVQWTDSIY